ncbi:Cold-shock' DNA-binding domain-containing protein OS=Bosea thiooxidans OX=53254 GN=SAMN05660750_04080 PE=4 SV= [Bosea thiooxidans]|uniref:'Cold-shock' DNA-binding domain-containing protein n=2 Tax=Bosea thiooxidans TaxID=53254 RepID=A0A1T5GIB3_9HYPH|nr:'Cold-shock' DNA-binding domain-containing protein [Bosea thiooxidans]
MFGTICRWGTRGFGFLRPDDGGEDLFIHGAAFKGIEPYVGQRVEYSEFRGRDGRVIAANAKLLSEEQAEALRVLG